MTWQKQLMEVSLNSKTCSFFQDKNGNHKRFYLSHILKNRFRRLPSALGVITTDHSPLNTIEIDSSLLRYYTDR